MAAMAMRRREEIRWIKHYCSGHDILFVGEGDFSFSLSLAMAFGSATNIVATSLDSYDELIEKYKNAKRNLAILEILGASILHEVDATNMKSNPNLQRQKFHRIIYNFPHAGFHGSEYNPRLIRMHRNLVRGFFRNARFMLKIDGEIHVNHKVTIPFTKWRIEDLALENSLVMIKCTDFNILDYPGYSNKRGSGSRCDEPFRLGSCGTFKFQLCPSRIPKMANKSPLHNDHGLMLNIDVTKECYEIFGGYLNQVEETFGSTSYDVNRTVREALKCGYERYTKNGGTLSGFIGILQELRRLSVMRSARLKEMILHLD